MELDDFFKLIDKLEYIPEVYIVRLEYKYTYEDNVTISNEILQYDPYYQCLPDSAHPQYHPLWCWYTDWYMCVDPSSIKVLKFTTLDDVFDVQKGD